MAHRVVVFACGEPLRGDDGAARLAVASLPPRARLAATVHLIGQLELDVVVAVAPGTPMIVVDTVVGVDPGRIVLLDLADLERRATEIRPRSTHQLPLYEVLGLAEALGHPVTGVFLGVGGQSFEPGSPISPEVSRALPALRAAVAEEIERMTEQRAAPLLVR